MLGKPKFKEGSLVRFQFGKDDYKIGTIYIVDKFGTFEDNSDVSYDIMVESENCLYKHIREDFVEMPPVSGI